MLKTKKLLKKAIVTLFIVAASIIILAVWISRDDYVPQKLGNSVSAALNNRYRLRYGCSIAENSDYIFYVNRSNNSCQLFRINKKSGEKTLLMSDVGDRNSGSLFIYKKSIIYAKSKDKNYQEFYYDIYSSDFDGKNVKLIKKKCEAPHMVIDDWMYFPGKDNSLSRISLVNGKERNVSGLECDKFVGIDKMNRNLYWFTEASYLTKLKINNRRTDLFLKNSNEQLEIGTWSGDVDSVNGVLGIVKNNIWFLGDNGLSLCKAEKKNNKWETKVIIDKSKGIGFAQNSVLEKDKIYYVSADESKVYMYDINSGKEIVIYEKPGMHISVAAAIGDHILIEEWGTNENHANAMKYGHANYYYINNSGKVLYELD
jgi:hypothetical protein